MIIMKKNKEQFLLIILSILMVIILSTNLYSFIIEESTLTSNIISIISLLMLITCIIIILSYKNNNLKEQRDSKEIDKNNYFMNLSHELRTPLNIILSTEQLITNLNSRNENIDKDKLNNYMDILRGNSKRLLKLINDIIDLSKIQEEMYNIDIMEHEIVFFVEDLALSMKEYIEAKGIELIIDPEIEEKIIECDINDIEKYKGRDLWIPREEAQELDEDEYYIADLLGMKVLLEDGSEFGTLKNVMETGANDVYIVDSVEHGEVLLPAIKECILDVDIETNTMTVHLMKGLL